MLSIHDWPLPADPNRARLGLERWHEAAAGCGDEAIESFARALSADPAGKRMLEAVFGNSPFLTETILREPGFMRDIVQSEPDALFERLIRETCDQFRDEADQSRLMTGLRRLRRRSALLIALADIGNRWELDEVTGALSTLADTCLRLACRHLLRQAAERGALELVDPADPERDSGLIVLGMGKLGGRELNYSSDIDLIVLYDDVRVRTKKPDEMARTFIRLTRDLVRIMEERTAEGYVFRTDLRLRPDPAATPPAVSVTAAEVYYGSMAQNWERAAMIKARPAAGDMQAGDAFLQSMRPFIWRRNLDFAAISDIHAIKRQIHAHRGHQAIAIEGHNVKLGRGGIREIEFFVQTQQMIFGGRNPRLRAIGTVEGLQALARERRIDEETARDLAEAYRFLRRVEHRLQMVNDQQTHELPDRPEGVAAIGTFLGFREPTEFRQRLRQTLERVEDCYAALFEEEPDMPGRSDLNFTGADQDERTLEALREMGFGNPDGAAALVRGWLHGRYRATRSEKARTLLTQLAPTLLAAVGKTANPDTALLRLDEFISRLPAGIQIFSLFWSNPQLLDLVAELLGTSGRLADYLARNPQLLDAVLTPGFMNQLPDPASLRDELEELLSTAGHFEEMLDIVRRWTNDHRFRAGVHILRRITDVVDCNAFLSALAEVGLQALIPRVEAEFATRHGGFGRPALATLAMGKLGGGEMSLRSDLDLIMVYDAPDISAESDGPKPLLAGVYYARLIHRIVNAITAPTGQGSLYEVDMRLRPSGSKGPVATGLEAFERYHAESAWTWEHMALTRARPVAGPPELCRRIQEVIRKVLTAPRDPDVLLRDVADMRARIEKQFPHRGVWDVKHGRGGMVDIEFLAQYLQLRHGHAHPEVLSPNTAEALERLGEARLIAPETAAELVSALRLWQRIQGYLRLTHEGRFEPETAPAALKSGLSRAAFPERDGIDFETAEALAVEAAARVHAHFRALIEEPAARLPREDAEDRAEKG